MEGGVIMPKSKLLQKLLNEIEEEDNAILTYMRQQGKYSNNQKMIEKYDSLIVEARETINQ